MGTSNYICFVIFCASLDNLSFLCFSLIDNLLACGILQKIFDGNQQLDHTFEGQDLDHNTICHKSDLIGQFDSYQDLKHNTEIKISESTQFIIEGGFDCSQFFGDDGTKKCGEEIIPNILPNIRPPPSAFLAPKCALWDCFRPAQGLQWCQDYCCSGHELLAKNEGLPGMTPILRPGGIDVKDGPLFAAVLAKTQGKEVGIPKCEGAASTKSPWNAPGN